MRPSGLRRSGSRRSGRLAGWPLRTRLIAAMVALLALVCLVISVVTVLTARHSLVNQVDGQLYAAVKNAREGGPKGGYHEHPPSSDDDYTTGPGTLFPPGQPAGTIGATVSDGQVSQVAILKPDRTGKVEPEPLRPADYPALPQLLAQLPADGHPHTLDLDDLGSYRLVAILMDSGEVRVTGLPLAAAQDTLWRIVAWEVVVAVAGLMAAAAAGAVIVRITLRPLKRVAATATRVAELPLDRGEVALSERVSAADTDPRTEVGQVGAALNQLLGHVGAALTVRHASETRVRQFLADASHELRTPLAAIRGYAELTRRSRDEVPPDVAHALRRVESETARMTTLVEDLLLLARLDSGRPLVREPVDLSRLIVDAASDAHATGPDHRWMLDLPDGPVTVPGDAQRLHQVLANILANARTHTPPGTTVTISLRVSPDRYAVVRVVDNGPGIPADLQPEVFERFARGDSSRSRAAGSTGLGLAIVAAVVDAHHGRVEVSSWPGRTEFAVRLPLDGPSGNGSAVPGLAVDSSASDRSSANALALDSSGVDSSVASAHGDRNAASGPGGAPAIHSRRTAEVQDRDRSAGESGTHDLDTVRAPRHRTG